VPAISENHVVDHSSKQDHRLLIPYATCLQTTLEILEKHT